MSVRYTKTLECLCVKKAGGTLSGSASIVRAKLSLKGAAVRTVIAADSEIKSDSIRVRTASKTITAESKVKSTLSAIIPHRGNFNSFEGFITNSGMVATYSPRQVVSFNSALRPTFLDKFAGTFKNFECEEKLYPSGDLNRRRV